MGGGENIQNINSNIDDNAWDNDNINNPQINMNNVLIDNDELNNNDINNQQIRTINIENVSYDIAEQYLQDYSILQYFNNNNIGNNINDYLTRLYELMIDISIYNQNSENIISVINRRQLNDVFGAIFNFYMNKVYLNYNNTDVANELMDFKLSYLNIFNNYNIHELNSQSLRQMANRLHNLTVQNNNIEVEASYNYCIAVIQ